MKKISDEVYYSEALLSPIGAEEIEFLRAQARVNPRRRCRLCLHKSPEDLLHEMVIAIARNSYVRPHKHPRKEESLHIIDGEASLLFFNEDGSIAKVVKLGPSHSQDTFLFRIAEPIFHTIVIHSETLVFHETTTGPFVREMTVFAPWAPEDETPAVDEYQKQLEEWIATGSKL
jgi:cupin fold WbuC family metalloprotein